MILKCKFLKLILYSKALIVRMNSDQASSGLPICLNYRGFSKIPTQMIKTFFVPPPFLLHIKLKKKLCTNRI